MCSSCAFCKILINALRVKQVSLQIKTDNLCIKSALNQSHYFEGMTMTL